MIFRVVYVPSAIWYKWGVVGKGSNKPTRAFIRQKKAQAFANKLNKIVEKGGDVLYYA